MASQKDEYVLYNNGSSGAMRSLHWLTTVGCVLAAVALTLSSVAMHEANQNQKRLDKLHDSPVGVAAQQHLAVASSTQRHSQALDAYSRFASMIASHPSCKESEGAYTGCMDLLSTTENVLAQQAQNKSMSEIADAIRAKALSVGRAHAFIAKDGAMHAHDGSATEGQAFHVTKMDSCTYTMNKGELSACFIAPTEKSDMAMLWGNIQEYKQNGASRRDNFGQEALDGALKGAAQGFLSGGGWKGALAGAIQSGVSSAVNYGLNQ